MHNETSAALRTAAERIMAVRHQWEGVGLFAIENLDTGACGLVLVPSDLPKPSWHARQEEALRTPAAWYGPDDATPDDAAPASAATLPWTPPMFVTHEELWLVPWLSKWLGTHGATTCHGRWTEFANLLALHVPRALVTAMPAATRPLACGHGMAVHTLPPSPDADPLLGRLVAWLLPWERLEHPGVPPTCAYWLTQQGVSRTWTGTALHGAGGRTRDERVAAGGMQEWAVLTCLPSVLDAVTAFLLAQAEALPATQPLASAPVVPRWRAGRPLSKDRCAVVLVAVHEALTGKADKARPGQERQRAAYAWATKHKTEAAHAALAGISLDWCPGWYLEQLRQEHGTALAVADLLRGVARMKAFELNVRKGMRDKQRADPRVPVPSSKKAHRGT